MVPRCIVICSVFLATLSFARLGLAQVQPPSGANPGSPVEAAAPISSEERLALERTILSDPRIRAIVGEGQPRIATTDVEFDKAEAEAFLAGRSTTLPPRRVTMVLINPQTQQAARALVEPAQGRIINVESIAASEVPFLREEAEEALALAKADPNVRRAVGDTLDRYAIVESGSEARVPFAAQALPLRSTDPRDVCSINRCVDLIFRTENGYLEFRAHIDLTRRTAEIHTDTGGQHR
jgi:hypothetical protein